MPVSSTIKILKILKYTQINKTFFKFEVNTKKSFLICLNYLFNLLAYVRLSALWDLLTEPSMCLGRELAKTFGRKPTLFRVCTIKLNFNFSKIKFAKDWLLLLSWLLQIVFTYLCSNRNVEYKAVFHVILFENFKHNIWDEVWSMNSNKWTTGLQMSFESFV